MSQVHASKSSQEHWEWGESGESSIISKLVAKDLENFPGYPVSSVEGFFIRSSEFFRNSKWKNLLQNEKDDHNHA